MKYILTIFYLLLVTVSAAPTNDVQQKVAKFLTYVTETLQEDNAHLTDEAMGYYLKREKQLKQINNYLADIDSLRETSETCVAAQDERIYKTGYPLIYKITMCEAEADHIAKACGVRDADTAINELVDIRESIYACAKGG